MVPGAREDDRAAPLAGLPATVKVDGRDVTFGPHLPARAAAEAYARKYGIDYRPPGAYVKVDPERSRRIAAAYADMPHAPQDPEVKAAYAALAVETVRQYEALLETGLKVEFNPPGGDPYGNPRNAIRDVVENNHLYIFPTDGGFGSSDVFDPAENPLLADSGFEISGRPARVNDLFRVVHDFFGHVKEGVGFRADGEENAWRQHRAMFSPAARRALTSETRGQNSWVNFGPQAERNKGASGADTVYADQKTGLLPEWVSEDQYGLDEAVETIVGNLCRAEDGKFAACGVPDPAEIASHEVALQTALREKRYAISTYDPGYGSRDTVHLLVAPHMDPELRVADENETRPTHRRVYDPRRAEIGPDGRVQARAGFGQSAEEAGARNEEGAVWRGMRYEEWQSALKQGNFQSPGDYNLGMAQRGLTYFSTDFAESAGYAAGFTPWQFTPTFDRPGVLVKFRDVETTPSPQAGTDSTERVVAGPVPFSKVAEVFFAEPYAISPGHVEVTKEGGPSDGKGGWLYRTGSRSSPSTYYGWRRVPTTEFQRAMSEAFTVLDEAVETIVGDLCRAENGQFTSCGDAVNAASVIQQTTNQTAAAQAERTALEVSKREVDIRNAATTEIEKTHAALIARYAVRADESLAQGDSRAKFARVLGERDGFVQYEWTPERAALHDRIIKDAFKGAESKDAPVIVFMGGLPGSGKTTAVGNDLRLEGKVVVNADDVKALLPEYAGYNAAYLHEESTEITEKMLELAREMRTDVVFDATMKSYGGAKTRVDQFKAAGYRVECRFVDVGINDSVSRAVQRLVRGHEKNGQGRYVPLEVIRSSISPTGTKPRDTFEKLRSEFDAFLIVDNRGKTAVEIARHGRLTESTAWTKWLAEFVA